MGRVEKKGEKGRNNGVKGTENVIIVIFLDQRNQLKRAIVFANVIFSNNFLL